MAKEGVAWLGALGHSVAFAFAFWALRRDFEAQGILLLVYAILVLTGAGILVWRGAKIIKGQGRKADSQEVLPPRWTRIFLLAVCLVALVAWAFFVKKMIYQELESTFAYSVWISGFLAFGGTPTLLWIANSVLDTTD